MPLYVHEVDARVAGAPAPAGAGSGGHGLRPEQFAALVDAVARELERRRRAAEGMRAEAAVTGTNRPPPVGG